MTSIAALRSAQADLFRRTLNKYWAGLLVVWLLSPVVLAFAVDTFAKPTYRTYSIIRVVPDPREGCTYGPGAFEKFDPLVSETVNSINTPEVLSRASADPRLASLSRIKASGNPAGELRKVVNVGVIPQTCLIEVSMTSDDPAETALVVNTVVESFFMLGAESSEAIDKNQIKTLQSCLADFENQIDELEVKWKERVRNGEIGSAGHNPKPPSRSSIAIDEYKVVFRELNEVKIELTRAEACLEAARAGKCVHLYQEIGDAALRVEQLKTKQATLTQHCANLELANNLQIYETLDCQLLLDKRSILQAMQENVKNRLEFLNGSKCYVTRITQMNKAVPPSKPISGRRPMLMFAIPFVMLFGAIGLFAGFEACFGSKIPSVKGEPLDEV